MRLLYVTHVCPWPAVSGTRIRNARLIEQLGRRHAVRVVVLDDPPPAGTPGVPAGTEFLSLRGVEAALSMGRWGIWSRALGDRLPELARRCAGPRLSPVWRAIRQLSRGFDLTWISRSYYGGHLVGPGLRTPLVIDYDEATTYAQRAYVRTLPWSVHRALSELDTVKLYAYEQRVARQAWRVVVCKDEDRAFFRHRKRNVAVVPNGTDLRPALPAAAADPNRLLFVGLMSYTPNADAVSWFARDCFPRVEEQAGHRLRFDVAGGEVMESVRKLHDGERVRILGFVPDLEATYREAGVVVAPMRLGSGTKLKVLESLAYGKPLVATAEAVRGIALRPGIDYLQAETPDQFAAACASLVADPGLRDRLGRNGRERVQEMYTWDRIGETANRVVTP